MSCTNVLIHNHAAFLFLSSMLQIDSKVVREILGIIPENYCHKSSRSREKKSDYYFKQTKG